MSQVPTRRTVAWSGGRSLGGGSLSKVCSRPASLGIRCLMCVVGGNGPEHATARRAPHASNHGAAVACHAAVSVSRIFPAGRPPLSRSPLRAGASLGRQVGFCVSDYIAATALPGILMSVGIRCRFLGSGSRKAHTACARPDRRSVGDTARALGCNLAHCNAVDVSDSSLRTSGTDAAVENDRPPGSVANVS